MNTNAIWQSPIYEFRIPAGADKAGHDLIKEVVVDVTTSAPRFADPGKTLGGVLGDVLDYLRLAKGEKISRILDFGAGKLRNTVYLLQKKHDVTAVEFGNLCRDTTQGRRACLRRRNVTRNTSKNWSFLVTSSNRARNSTLLCSLTS